MSILVDTGAWYAVADASDRHHREAAGFYTECAGRERLVTTDLILAETFALLASHLRRRAALTFWENIREARIPVLCAQPADVEAAWRIARDFADQDFSFVDCTTFAIMERSGIHDAFAFDGHFLVYRFGIRKQHAFRRLPG